MPQYKIDSNSCCFCLKKSLQLAEHDTLNLTIVQLEESRTLNRKVASSILTQVAVFIKKNVDRNVKPQTKEASNLNLTR